MQHVNGADDYLDGVTALDEVQQLHGGRLSTRLTLVEDRTALCRALLGSSETRRERER